MLKIWHDISLIYPLKTWWCSSSLTFTIVYRLGTLAAREIPTASPVSWTRHPPRIMSCVSSGAGQVYYKREFAGTDLEVRGFYGTGMWIFDDVCWFMDPFIWIHQSNSTKHTIDISMTYLSKHGISMAYIHHPTGYNWLNDGIWWSMRLAEPIFFSKFENASDWIDMFIHQGRPFSSIARKNHSHRNI